MASGPLWAAGTIPQFCSPNQCLVASDIPAAVFQASSMLGMPSRSCFLPLLTRPQFMVTVYINSSFVMYFLN